MAIYGSGNYGVGTYGTVASTTTTALLTARLFEGATLRSVVVVSIPDMVNTGGTGNASAGSISPNAALSIEFPWSDVKNITDPTNLNFKFDVVLTGSVTTARFGGLQFWSIQGEYFWHNGAWVSGISAGAALAVSAVTSGSGNRINNTGTVRSTTVGVTAAGTVFVASSQVGLVAVSLSVSTYADGISSGNSVDIDRVETDDILDAILSGKTRVTRRCEIYESDGNTPWQPGIVPRLIDGSVTASVDGNIRRNIDITLDNADGGINHNPNGGLWYDKILKVYRGIKYPNRKKMPTIGLVGFNFGTNSKSAAKFMGRLGMTDFVTINIANAIPEYIDILVAWKTGSDFDALTAAFLAKAYIQNHYILTVNNFATSSTVPIITSTLTRAGTVQWTLNPTVTDTFLDSMFTISYKANAINGETLPSGIRATAVAGATDTYSATTVYPIIFEQDTAGGRWVHYHPIMTDAITPSSAYSRMMRVLQSVINWFYTTGDEKIWEIQLGEFMIDSIAEPRFPKQLQLTGRDYGKKLDLFKLIVPTTFSTGSNIDNILVGLGTQAGLTKFRVNTGAGVTTSDLLVDRTTSILDTFDQLGAAYNFEHYIGRYGHLIARPYRDPTTAPIALELQGGQINGNLIDFTKASDDSELYNYVVVTGTNADGTGIYSGKAVNDDPDSVMSTVNIGARMYFYTSEFFTSSAQCQKYAARLLAVKGLESFSVDFSSLVFPQVEVGEILHSELLAVDGFSDRYLLTQVQIPLGLGSMSGNGKRVIIVSDSGTLPITVPPQAP